MYTRLQLFLIAGTLLVCGAARPIEGEDFKGLVDKASQDLEAGACLEAQRGFSQALKMANEAVGVATLPEAIHASLLLGEVEVCLGQFEAAANRVAVVAARTAENGEFRSQIQFLMAEAAKGKAQYSVADKNYTEAFRLSNESLPEADPRRSRYLAAWADLSRLRGQYDDSEARIQQAFSLLGKIGQPDSIERAYVLVAAADLARDRESWADARNRYDEAVAMVKNKAPDHPTAARALLGRGLVELAAGDPATAEKFLRLAQTASHRLTTSDTYFAVQDALGLVELNRHKLKEAEDYLVVCRDNRVKYRGDQHPSTAASLDHVGLLYMEQHRFDQALEILKKAQEVRRKVLGPDHPELAQTLYHLGRLYRIQRKFQDSAASLYEALTIEKTKLGPESLAVALSLTEQGRLFTDQGKYSEAEPPYRQALAIEEKRVPLQAPTRLESLRGLALALHGEGKDTEAEPSLTQWMKSRGESLPLLDPDRLPVAVALAEIEIHDGKHVAAEKELTEILSANEKAGKDAARLPIVHKDLGDALFAEKKWKDAERNYEAALPEIGNQADLVRVLENLGTCYAAQNQWADSITWYQKALDASKKDGASDTVLGRLTLVLTDVSWDAGRPAQATSYLNQWMSVHGTRADSLTLDEARVLEKSASYFSIAKQYDKAEPVLRLLLRASDQPGSQGVNLNRILIQLADITAAEKKSSEAAALYERLARRSRAVRQLADSERYLLLSKELRQRDGGATGVGSVSTLLDLGETYVAENKYPDARTAFDQARAILEQNGLADDPRMAVSLNGLGEVLQGEHNFDDAAKVYDQANDLLKKSTSPPPRVLASVLYNIGSLKMSNGKVGEAANYFAQCLKLSQGNYTAENPPPIEQFDQIAGAYERQGRFDEAEKLYRENFDLRRKFFGENSTEAAWGLYFLAVFYNQQKQYDKAADTGERALHYFEGRSGEESEEVAVVLNLLATIYSAKHDMDHALVAMERSATIQQKLGRPRDEIMPMLSALGEYYRNRKDYVKALQTYQKMADLWQAESFEAPNYQRAVLAMAIMYAHISDFQHSRESYNKLQKWLQQRHDSIQQTKAATAYADALREVGQDKEARKILDQAGSTARAPGRD